MNDTSPEVCGACTGVTRLTPVDVTNPAGRATLIWRVGTHARFKQSMQASLAADPALRALATRDDDDPTVALIDAWAVSLDVLTFYQERFANEHYLRTATERRSILELARAIGYELAPGVSANTHLAFTMENVEGAPPRTVVPAGTKAQSIPGQNEKPQLFETAEPLEARAAWSALRAKATEPSGPTSGDTVLWLQTVDTGLRIGDLLLVASAARVAGDLTKPWALRKVAAFESLPAIDPARGRTRVTLDAALPALGTIVRVFALRQRAAIFGAAAPSWSALGTDVQNNYLAGEPDDERLKRSRPTEWPRWSIYAAKASNQIDLDQAYPAIVTGSFVVLERAGAREMFRVTGAQDTGRAQFFLSGRVTRLTLADGALAQFEPHVRETAAYVHSEELRLAERPRTSPLGGASVVVESSAAAALPAGRLIAALGYDASGAEAGEVAVLASAVPAGAGFTRLTFSPPLAGAYKPDTLIFNANVVAATHGETTRRVLPGGLEVTEVLGSGDGAQAFQRFTLKQKPLTYVAAANARGRATSLAVRIDGVLWREVPTLHGAGSDERVYTVRHHDDGAATVQFGDGVNGARLPTGQENVSAIYRVGTGLAGQVAARQISLLMSRPLGVTGVLNPEPPSGAGAPETLATARRHAPLTVLTFDRIVSRQDYEDFARGFAGIGQAGVTLLWSGETQVVHLTVALADGSSPAATNPTLVKLRAALQAARHAVRQVIVQGHATRPFAIAAKVAVDPKYVTERVLADVRAAVLATFAFGRREFGQDVSQAEVIAAMQAVPGVVFVDLDTLRFRGGAHAIDGRLEGRPARPTTGGGMAPADLLTLAPEDITLTAIAP